MKFAFIFIVAILLSIAANAQQFSVSADKMNIAYIGINNPLTIVADNCSCAELIASTDNGTIIKKDSCHFIYNPVQPGKTTINIQRKRGSKSETISRQEMRVKYIPDPVAMVGDKQSGSYPLNEFKVQAGVRAAFPRCELDMKAIIVSFKIALESNGQVLFTESTNGNHFSANAKAAFARLKIGDIVRVEEMTCVLPDSRPRRIGDLIFTMR